MSKLPTMARFNVLLQNIDLIKVLDIESYI